MAVRPDVAAIRRLTALSRQEQPKWFVQPVAVVLLIIPVALGLGVEVEYLPGVLMAYVNLILIGLITIRCVRCGSLEALVPVGFLSWFAAAFPTTSIYCALFQPRAFYETIYQTRYILDGNLRVQMVLFVFLLGYGAITSLAVSRRAQPFQLAVDLPSIKRLALITFWFAIGANLFNAASKLRELPEVWQYLADGFITYVRGLFFILGAAFVNLRMLTRIIGVVCLLFIMVFYVLGNRREFAAWPFVLFVLGLLFAGRLRQKTKFKIMVGFVLFVPVFMVIANTTRVVLGTVGFQQLGARAAALTRWREEALTGSIPGRALGRLFSTGGHSLMTLSPERYSYLDFNPQAYMQESLTRLLPGRLYYKPYYSTTGRLERYDFLITEETSVELSMLGSLWMIGGYLPVVVGGVCIGILHVILMRVIRGAVRGSSFKGIFYFSMVLPTLMWGHNLDPITHFRAVVWKTAAAILLYYLLIAHLEGRTQVAPQLPAAEGRTSPPGRS